ncbi:hypothetical protein DH2020_002951 [Rehmannia glutinosa]|uniref:Uncharacterized protein n=1 Tax=Rehmannia glutinosa TaxID=99300 RepID=A0ABR0XVM9_REHGL
MSISVSSIATTSTITNLRPFSPIALPSTRFFGVPFAGKTHLLRLWFANSSHTSCVDRSSFGYVNGLDFEYCLYAGKWYDAFSKYSNLMVYHMHALLICVGAMLEARVIRFRQQFCGEAGILSKLKRYGVSGILSYGLLNTAYYLTTFLVVWFYVAPAPGKMGYLAAAERFLKVMAMVWAGSQVTKLIRAGGALALAPFVDRGLSWFTVKFGFKSQGKAFVAIAGFCFGLAFLMFVIVTLLWA